MQNAFLILIKSLWIMDKMIIVKLIIKTLQLILFQSTAALSKCFPLNGVVVQLSICGSLLCHRADLLTLFVFPPCKSHNNSGLAAFLKASALLRFNNNPPPKKQKKKKLKLFFGSY